MKRIAIAMAAACLLAAPGFASPAGHEYVFSDGVNTLPVTFHADGAFTDARGWTGEWREEADGQICIDAGDGGGDGEFTCGEWPDIAIGESFTTTEFSIEGAELTVTRTR